MIENNEEMGFELPPMPAAPAFDSPCPGPMIWFDAGPGAALLECATCGRVFVAGSFFDAAHQDVSLLREGLAQ